MCGCVVVFRVPVATVAALSHCSLRKFLVRLYSRHDMTDSNVLSREIARAALNSILKAIDQSENAFKIKEAKSNAGNDMIKRMQFVFPIVMMLQMDVIKGYGFSEGRQGIIQFTQLIRTLERDDPEIALLHSRVRAHFLPEVPPCSGVSP